MPVYLFTFHGYQSWMPDRRRGYVRRDEGILPPDPEMAERYREAAKDEPTVFTRELQRALLEELHIAARFQRFRLHAGSTEPSHLHGLVSWNDDRAVLRLRNSIKQSLSRRLTKESAPDQLLRLSEGASQRRVRDRNHLNYLTAEYLPKHRGVAWYDDERGWVNQFLQ